MSQEEKLKWEEMAAKDKQRYLTEKSLYTGDWKVQVKKAKKDSRAPKRPPSAFLFFSGAHRRPIKEKNPGMCNTDVSKELGRMWREMKEEERKPFVEREKEEREKYLEDMVHYKKEVAEEEAREKEKKDEEQREFQEKVQKQMKKQEEYAAKGGYDPTLYAGAYGVGTTTAASGNDAAELSEASTAAATATAASAAASANFYGYAPYPQYWPLPDGSNAVAAQAYAAAYAYPAAQQVQVAPGQYQPLGALGAQAGFQGGALGAQVGFQGGALGPQAGFQGGALGLQAGFQGGAPQVLGPTGLPQTYQAAYAFPSGDTAASPEEAAAAEGQYDV